jgi:hypothetical protein
MLLKQSSPNSTRVDYGFPFQFATVKLSEFTVIYEQDDDVRRRDGLVQLDQFDTIFREGFRQDGDVRLDCQ